MPRFLWPSLGRPCFTSGEDPGFTAFIAAPKDVLDRAALSNAFSLIPVHDRGRTVPLETRAVEERDGPPRGSAVRKALAKSGLSFFEVRLAMSGDHPEPVDFGRNFVLFDLAHPLVEPGRHSVVYRTRSWDRFRFWVVTDTHVAEMWDRIQTDFGRWNGGDESFDPARLPTLKRAFGRKAFEDNYVNPNRNLVHFIRAANERASRGALDFVILGGDVVDYQFRTSETCRKPAYADTNFDLFERIVTGRYELGVELQVPLLTVPGNHDYRLFPYQLRHYGLDRCGLHDLQTEVFLRKTLGKRRGRFSLSDLKAIGGTGGGSRPLETYLTHINPETDFSWKIGGTKFVFLNTGKDAFRNAFHVRPRRWKNLFRAILNSWHFPNSEGLSDGQAKFLTGEVQGTGLKNVVLVFHAGLINTHFTAGTAFPFHAGEYLNWPDRIGRRIRLEKGLTAAGMNYGGLFQNQLSLLRTGAVPGLRVLGLSGHFHRNLELRLDKRTGDIHRGDFCRAGLTGAEFGDSAYFLSGSALAHVQARYPIVDRPEFFAVEIDGGEIASVKRESLRAFPLDGILFEARKTHETGLSTTISVVSEIRGREPGRSAGDMKMFVSFIVFAAPARESVSGFPFEIEVPAPNRVIAIRQEWLTDTEQQECFGRKRSAYLFSCFCDFSSGMEFVFHRVGRSRGHPRVVALAEYFSDNGSGLKSLKRTWHPRSMTLGS